MQDLYVRFFSIIIYIVAKTSSSLLFFWHSHIMVSLPVYNSNFQNNIVHTIVVIAKANTLWPPNRPDQREEGHSAIYPHGGYYKMDVGGASVSLCAYIFYNVCCRLFFCCWGGGGMKARN